MGFPQSGFLCPAKHVRHCRGRTRRKRGRCGEGADCGTMDLSVVIPVKNEAGNIAPLVAEIAAALDGLVDYEIVYVDDGSTDSTAIEIRDLQDSIPRLRLVRHAKSCGQSAAIRSGIKAARG